MEFLLNGSRSLRQVMIPPETELVCALGCFDGVHIGHRALIDEILADRNGLTSAVWTFSEPLAKPFIERVEDRLHILSDLGVKFAICESYEKVKDMSALSFLTYLSANLNVKRIVCGSDFRFGKDREGDVDFIRREAPALGISVTVKEPVYAQIGEEKLKVNHIQLRVMGYGCQNIFLTRSMPATSTSISSFVLYRPNEARTVPSMPRRVMSGWAQ